jgi:hypothetical protein
MMMFFPTYQASHIFFYMNSEPGDNANSISVTTAQTLLGLLLQI